MKIHHIGFVTQNIEKKRKELSLILKSAKQSKVYLDKVVGVRVQFFKFENTMFELVEPVGEKSSVYNFLKKRGEALHHIAYEVSDIEKQLALYKKKGFIIAQEIWKAPAIGGKKVFFLHPKSTGRLLLEFIEA